MNDATSIPYTEYGITYDSGDDKYNKIVRFYPVCGFVRKTLHRKTKNDDQ